MLDLLPVGLRAASHSRRNQFGLPCLLRKTSLPGYHGRQPSSRGCPGPGPLGAGIGHSGISGEHGACQALPQETGAGLILPVYFMTFLPSCSNVSLQLDFTDIIPSRNAGISLSL